MATCDVCKSVIVGILAGYKGYTCVEMALAIEADCLEATVELEPESGVACTALATIVAAYCAEYGAEWIVKNAEQIAEEVCKKVGLC
ncbi:hypothetical protein JYT32_00440 [Dehalococcoides mccartyi]|nr:hypothetical protein [Dehalococcoides mccartyi]